MGVFNGEHQFCNRFEVKSQETHFFSGLYGFVKACACRCQPGEECEGKLKIVRLPKVESRVPDLCTLVILDFINKMWLL